MFSKMPKNDGKFGAPQPPSTAQSKPAPWPRQQQDEKFGAPRPPSTAQTKPAPWPRQQQDKKFGAPRPPSTAQTKPAPWRRQQQDEKFGAPRPPSTAQTKPAPWSRQQQDEKFGAPRPPSTAQTKPAPWSRQQQDKKFGAPRPPSTAQTKPAPWPRQQQDEKFGAPCPPSTAQTKPAPWPRQQQDEKFGAPRPPSTAQTKPAPWRRQQQDKKFGAPRPPSTAQTKPAYCPRQQQNEKFGAPHPPNTAQTKPAHWPLGGRYGALPPLNVPQSKPAYKPFQQQVEDQKPATRDLKTTFKRLPLLVHTQHQLEKDTFPMTPTDVLNKYGKNMTKFEHDEILNYPEIWYLGHISKNDDTSQTKNKTLGTPIKIKNIAYRYEVLKMLGKGTYGMVWKCLDHKTNELVAIKVVHKKNVIKAEMNILEFLREKDRDDSHNIVHMKEYFSFRNQLCIVFELLGQTLREVINECKRLSMNQVWKIACDVLKCLSLLEKEKIVHADLKPENIAMSPQKSDCIKVIDFGFSCFEHLQEFQRVGTRIYRAPEVMVCKHYTTAIDMWSLGCTLVRLYTGQHLFNGENDVDIMSRMMEVLGKPPTEYISSRKELFFDSEGQRIRVVDHDGQIRGIGCKKLASVLNTDDSWFLDFIKRCIVWDPDKRLTAQEALQHKWIKDGPKAKTKKQMKCHYT